MLGPYGNKFEGAPAPAQHLEQRWLARFRFSGCMDHASVSEHNLAGFPATPHYQPPIVPGNTRHLNDIEKREITQFTAKTCSSILDPDRSRGRVR
jgi:hypothetical protein